MSEGLNSIFLDFAEGKDRMPLDEYPLNLNVDTSLEILDVSTDLWSVMQDSPTKID
jgi:hypothetical protein